MALILSGLVHGVMFLYQFSDTGGSDVGQAASVTVQLELVSQVKKSVNENIAETKSVKKVVASESAAELRDTSEVSDGQSNMDAYLEQFTVEADIISDYTDRHVADQNQVVEPIRVARVEVLQAKLDRCVERCHAEGLEYL